MFSSIKRLQPRHSLYASFAALGCAFFAAAATAQTSMPASGDIGPAMDAPPTTLSSQPGASTAQSGSAAGSSNEDLANKLANPVASLISVPFQFNYLSGISAHQHLGNGDRLLLNVQPVVPLTLNEDWNLIIRTIVPVIYQHDVVIDGTSSQFGLGDTTQSFFFSPKAPGPGGMIWGVGPAFLWPTGTNDSLGSGKWAVGPTGLVLFQNKPWTLGVLANHLWSYAGDDDRPYVNSTFIQPFINYTTQTATSFFLNTESTYDWNNNHWTIPINIGVNQLLKIGDQPMQIGIGYTYYADAPEGGPDWGIRLNFVLLFPK